MLKTLRARACAVIFGKAPVWSVDAARFAVLGLLIAAPIVHLMLHRQGETIDAERERYRSSRVASLRTALGLAQDDLRLTSELIFREIIVPSGAADLLGDAQAEPERADELRDELFERTGRVYDQLRRYGVKQLHFHTRENRSFLRMHRPERFGDDLTDVRETVRLANAERRLATGFEEGRIFNGFRIVYPLESNGEHVGSVEISAPSSVVLGRIASDMHFVQFLIRKDIFEAKVFDSVRENYRPCGLARGFVVETNEFVDSGKDSNERLATLGMGDKRALREAVEATIRGSDGVPASASMRHDGIEALIVCLPVRNAKSEEAAMVLGIERSAVLEGLSAMQRRQSAATLLVAAALVIIGSVLGAEFRRSKLRVRQQRDISMHVERAAAAKSEFLANMSHEIRTPMTAILGYVELLEDQDVGFSAEETRDAHATIRVNAEHLLRIINDILDVSKIEAGRMSIEMMRMDPAVLVEEVASLTRPRAVSKGVSLKVSYDTPIPQSIRSDPTRLRQVLLNLVANAIKFTEIGEVRIAASFDADAELISFAVSDTGIGMSADQVDAIGRFEAFQQADTSTARRFGGTVLGLRIVHSLTDLLGGSVELSSRQGVGSTFTATASTGPVDGVPMRHPGPDGLLLAEEERAQSACSSGVASKPTPGLLRGVRILLAEDGPDNQRLISFHLRRAGAEVTIVGNGKLAIEAINGSGAKACGVFDVVLMDMQMPELDGYDATRQLRAAGCEVPIAALTAHAMEADRERCLNAGCDEFLSKPIDSERLIDGCHRLSQRGRSCEPLAA